MGGRLAGLDRLRGVAVLLVLGRHMGLPADGPPGTARHALVAVLAAWRRGGWVGVDLFFVLSGFLVGGLLLREAGRTGRVDAGRFLARRAFKLYPGLWALTLAGLVAYGPRLAARQVAGELLFLQNYWANIWLYTWTLAVEEHFYLGLTLVAWWSARRGGRALRHLPAAWPPVAAACLLGRLAAPPAGRLLATHLRADTLLLGVALAALVERGAVRLPAARAGRWPLLALGGLGLAPAALATPTAAPWLTTGGPILFALASACLVAGSAAPGGTGPGRAGWLAAVGRDSYSIYLWHGPAALWLAPVAAWAPGRRWWPPYAAAYLGGSLALGWAMARLVEWPLLRARDRLVPPA
jgi:peptidoglycan/LPS O-acetylase OafA/YrhL